MNTSLAIHLARNIKQLREARNLTQDQLAKLAEIPRPTVANLESGESNPTLSVLAKLATALQVSVESLISPPRAATKFYPASALQARRRNDVLVRKVLPDSFGLLEIERIQLPPNSRMLGMPHKA